MFLLFRVFTLHQIVWSVLLSKLFGYLKLNYKGFFLKWFTQLPVFIVRFERLTGCRVSRLVITSLQKIFSEVVQAFQNLEASTPYLHLMQSINQNIPKYKYTFCRIVFLLSNFFSLGFSPWYYQKQRSAFYWVLRPGISTRVVISTIETELQSNNNNITRIAHVSSSFTNLISKFIKLKVKIIESAKRN